MLRGIVDTNILIELYRKNAAAITWFSNQSDLGVTTISWLEFMHGAAGKQGQQRCLQIVAQFTIEHLSTSDQDWAMQQLLRYRLSHGVSKDDCLISSVCNQLQIPMFTRNVKDFTPMLGSRLVVAPY
jgi:predicted nucleic acid-binding protein